MKNQNVLSLVFRIIGMALVVVVMVIIAVYFAHFHSLENNWRDVFTALLCTMGAICFFMYVLTGCIRLRAILSINMEKEQKNRLDTYLEVDKRMECIDTLILTYFYAFLFILTIVTTIYPFRIHNDITMFDSIILMIFSFVLFVRSLKSYKALKQARKK